MHIIKTATKFAGMSAPEVLCIILTKVCVCVCVCVFVYFVKIADEIFTEFM